MPIKQLSQSESPSASHFHAGLDIENRHSAKFAAAQNACNLNRPVGGRRRVCCPGSASSYIRSLQRGLRVAKLSGYICTSQEQEYPYDSFIEEQVHSVTRFNVLSEALRRLNPGVWRYPGETAESAVDRLQHLLTVKRDGLSYQVMISLQGGDPTHLADIVNAVTDSYLEATKDEEFYGRDKRLDALRQERTEVQES